MTQNPTALPVRQLSIQRASAIKKNWVVKDADGAVLYQADWKLAALVTPWVVTKDGVEVATMRRKPWSLSEPTWTVTTPGDGDFEIRGQLFSILRRTYVAGSALDGATLTGSLTDWSFRIERDAALIAEADRRMFTISHKHGIHLHDQSLQAELLTTLMLVQALVEQAKTLARMKFDA